MAHEELETLKAELFTPELDARADQGPAIPVKAKLVELRIKAEKIDQDSDHFTATGLSAAVFSTKILDIARALETANTLCSHTPEEISEAEAIMAEYDSEELEAIRAEIFSRLNYLLEFEGHNDLRTPLRRISEGNDIKDTILDIGGCFELARYKADALARLAYDTTKIDKLGEVYAKVSEAYPKVKAGDIMEVKARELRNRVYWYAVDYERKLREAVFPMVFNKDGSWIFRYSSDYRGTHRKKKDDPAIDAAAEQNSNE